MNEYDLCRIVALWKVAVENPEVRNIIIFDITYVNGLAPFPKEIAQNERHLVEFFGNVFTPSPYVTKKQKLKVMYVIILLFRFYSTF